MEMKVISLENRKGVKLGEIKEVRRGYGRYLIRYKKAFPYDKARVDEFSQMRASLEQQEADRLQAAQVRAAQLKDLAIQVHSRATDEGQLYGSLGAREIAEAITKAGVSVEKQAISLIAGPIRHIGDHEVLLYLHDQIKVKITIQVNPALS